MRSSSHQRHQKGRLGYTLVELLVSMGITSVVLTGVVNSFAILSKISSDHNLKVVAELEAQSIIDMMTPDIRMIGNGVPFHQANFLIAQENLANNTVTQPILVAGTTATQMQFRLNESGETYIVSSDYDPSASGTVTLTSVNKIAVGDEVYITNSTVGGDDGLWGVVQAINSGAHTVTFAAGYQYSESATFEKGSLLEVVPVVTYSSTANFGGITRNDGYGALTLTSHGDFSVRYVNSAGTELTLPLVASSADPFPANAIQNARFVEVTVRVRSTSPLSTGSYYTATSTQQVGIRNLNYNY